MKSIVRKHSISDKELAVVLSNPHISPGAKGVYSFLSTLKSGSQICSNDLVENNVATSVQMVNRYKRELAEFKLVHENKDPISNIRFIYIGSFYVNALVFAQDWKNVPVEDNKHWVSDGGYE